MPRPLDVVSLLPLGPRPYDEVVVLQKEAEARAKAGGRETLFLLEHEDVITAGRNAGTDDLHLPAEQLARLGVAFHRSDRGGKLTFHGPGQLVAYPVLRLEGPERDVRRFVRNLEEVLILTASDFGVAAQRSDVPARWSSVWVGNDKLAAIGVHLSDWVTTHGIGLNVTTRLERFDLREREERGFIVDIGRCCHDGQHERDSQQQHEQQRGQFLFHGVRLLT